MPKLGNSPENFLAKGLLVFFREKFRWLRTSSARLARGVNQARVFHVTNRTRRAHRAVDAGARAAAAAAGLAPLPPPRAAPAIVE